MEVKMSSSIAEIFRQVGRMPENLVFPNITTAQPTENSQLESPQQSQPMSALMYTSINKTRFHSVATGIRQ